MDTLKIGKYKKILESEKSNLLGKIETEEEHEDFGSDQDHLDEEADEAESLGTKIAIGTDYRKRISDIDTALQKIKEGRYGICEKCGGEIEEDVLTASPESKFCKNCKREK